MSSSCLQTNLFQGINILAVIQYRKINAKDAKGAKGAKGC